MSLNVIHIVGRLGRDPEVRDTRGGTLVCNLSVATSSKPYTDASGQRHEDTQWHNVVFWGNICTTVEKYFKKGSMIGITGELRYEEYTDREGIKKVAAEIRAQSFFFVGGSSARSGNEDRGNQEQRNHSPESSPYYNDDIPF